MKTELDHEYYERARKRTKQKKRLYFHFVLFLVGSSFFVILNKVINFHPELDWYVWAISIWFVLLVLHTINVFVMNRFFGKEWERVQTEKLLQKHKEKLEKLEAKLEKSGAFDELKENS
ncbi:2TM domain-containing protein [Lutimonas saemankumensis]|uniref:2TM domain-containing protein n=1 Tax=Lutimonas saemankumensis TaxID=483016 RepID=UPI001CD23BCD|nr:2TM domain-containing protein [Lutimonas saemankumensis]MCA0933544.1 2TM domain-containing protein [Lutimonas saemankumensis]